MKRMRDADVEGLVAGPALDEGIRIASTERGTVIVGMVQAGKLVLYAEITPRSAELLAERLQLYAIDARGVTAS